MEATFQKPAVSSDGNNNSVLAGLRNFLLILAFSVHNLFEGMAVGLEDSVSGQKINY